MKNYGESSVPFELYKPQLSGAPFSNTCYSSVPFELYKPQPVHFFRDAVFESSVPFELYKLEKNHFQRAFGNNVARKTENARTGLFPCPANAGITPGKR